MSLLSFKNEIKSLLILLILPMSFFSICSIIAIVNDLHFTYWTPYLFCALPVLLLRLLLVNSSLVDQKGFEH